MSKKGSMHGSVGHGRRRFIVTGPALLAFFFLVAGGVLLAGGSTDAGKRGEAVPEVEEELVAVAKPPFSEGIFPCSDCHDGTDVDTTRRELDDHADIVFEHDAKNRWCLDCHDATDRDRLHLADGTLVEFTESYRLCGQCHGPKLRDWKAGAHGKRTGLWSGRKEYQLCVHCHDPHTPGFKPMEPLPPPVRPKDL